jgi:hypothetical protein
MKPMSDKLKFLLGQIISTLLILLFIYTALSKFYDRSFFEAQLHFYPYINKASVLLSWLLPSVELLCGLLLIAPFSRLAGLYITLTLLIIFTTYLAVMLIVKNDLPCSCGGVIQQMTWQQHILFNVVFIILSRIGIIASKKNTNQKLEINKGLFI